MKKTIGTIFLVACIAACMEGLTEEHPTHKKEGTPVAALEEYADHSIGYTDEGNRESSGGCADYDEEYYLDPYEPIINGYQEPDGEDWDTEAGYQDLDGEDWDTETECRNTDARDEEIWDSEETFEVAGEAYEEEAFPADYIYYWHLSDAEKTVYRQIYQGVENHEKGVIRLAAPISSAEIATVNMSVEYDNPEFFYWLRTELCWLDENESVTQIQLCYNRLEEDYEANAAAIYQVVEFVVNETSGMSEYEQVKYVNDYLALNSSYVADPDVAIDQTPWILVSHTGVCASYAKAAHLIFREMGIEAYYILGDAGETMGTNRGSHAWLKVMVDGSYRDLDITWDDPGDERGVIYDYFLTEYTDHSRCPISYIVP